MIDIIDILINRQDLSKLGLIEQKVFWGGEEYSQDPPKYIYNSKLILTEISDMQYYKKHIKNGYNISDFIALTIDSGQISDLEIIINNQQSHNEHIILDFISSICISLDEFGILLIRDEECIDDRYELKDGVMIIKTIIRCFDRNACRGAIILR